MSQMHLKKGDAKPPKIADKLRLYSMAFCPFAQRARMVLVIKGVPHDIVNINLKNKPEWMFEMNSKGEVPIIDTGSKIVTESLDCSDFLDELYPKPPLYPKDSEKRQQDKELIKSFGNLVPVFGKAMFNPDKEPLSAHVERVRPQLMKLENELQQRGIYFGGEQPNMVDYMLWPLAERVAMFEILYGEKLPDTAEFSQLYGWCKNMRSQKAVQQTATSAERLAKLCELYKDPTAVVDYDSI